MAHPQAGRELVAGITTFQVPPRSLGIWFLNQFGYVFKTPDGTTIYVDPYLSDALEQATRGQSDEHIRLFMPPIAGTDVTNADYVFCTHDHLDHLDPVACQQIAKASPHCKFVGPSICRSHFLRLGIAPERIITVQANDTVNFGTFRVTGTPGAHEAFDLDPEHGHVFIGYVMEFDGATLWHSGDTVLFEGLADCVRPFRPDLAFLPINGRNYYKLKGNIRGNMNYVEAADIAVDLGVDIVFPSHWGQHACNTEHVGYFVDYITNRYRYQRFRILVPGERMLYAR
ncbi:MAG TPA: MBL fold metallo-hydrolase [Symbiobacteriaceae bacterium]|nr:MBL fold metallo-hydrolase [Symbiobacteriaceae bacterium]